MIAHRIIAHGGTSTSRYRYAITALIFAVTATRGSAQTFPCEPTLTIAQCRAKLVTNGPQDAIKANAAQVVQQRSTGGDAPQATGAGSVTNFLPRLAAAIITPGLSGDTAALSINVNLPFNDGILFAHGFTAQLSLVAHHPQLYTKLIDTVPASIRDATRKRLEGTLNDLDDADFGVTVNVDNHYFGRTVTTHTEELNALAASILAVPRATLDSSVDKSSELFLKLIDPAQKKDPACQVTDLDALLVRCITLTRVESFFAALIARDAAATAYQAESKQLLHASGFDRIADLIDNQPQFNLGVVYRNRRDIVGPNEWKGNARLEWGFANLNRLRRYCKGSYTATCVANFMQNGAVTNSLDHGDRVAITLDYTSQPAYAIVLPHDTASLSLKQSRKFTPAINYGRYLGKQADGTDRGRIDAKFQVVLVQQDALRQNQKVASLTLTQPISNQSSALFGLSWANHPEFLGSVDHVVRANVGLTYHMVSQKK